jgi:hypothetical protein
VNEPKENSNGRISISEDRLRAMFSEFKLELVKEFEKFATIAAFEMLDTRVKVLELWQAGIIGVAKERNDVSRRTIAWAGLIVALLGAIAALIFQIATN